MSITQTEVFGLRILVRSGLGNVVRIILAVLWLGAMLGTIAVQRDDLLHPADFGSDTSNYVAAGERALNVELYRLSPGDRPVPADNPPDWSVPILSPPPVGTVWAGLAWLPDPLRFHLLWALGLAGTCWLVLYLTARLHLLLLIPGYYLFATNLAVMAWSGNVNALIAPGLALVWLLLTSSRARQAGVVAGAIVGLSALLKLGPAFVGLWLLSAAHWRAVAAALVTTIVVGLLTLVLVGPADFGTYLDIIRASSGTASPLSIPGFASALGVPVELRSLVLGVVLTLAALVVVVARREPRFTFTVAVIAAVMATTIVRPETIAVGVAAAVPWVSREGAPRWHPQLPTATTVNAMVSPLVAVAAVVAMVATGGLARSSMQITNSRPEPVIVRYTVPFQGASFGYRLEPGSSGVAWSDRMGKATGYGYVLSADCRILDRLPPRPDASTLWIQATHATDGPPVTGAFLPYVADCAAEVRADLGSR